MGPRSHIHALGKLIGFFMQHFDPELSTSVIPGSQYRTHLKLDKSGPVYDRTLASLRTCTA
jgi:hypothetical protein